MRRPPRLLRAVAFSMLVLLAGCGGTGGAVHGSGTVEMDEVDVASLVGGRIASLAVDEGDTVRAGDTLAVLDRGELSADLQSQAAQAERALAQYRDVRSGPRASEIRIARSELDAASSQAALAETEFRRVEALLRTQAAAQGDLDKARAARDAGVAKRDAAADQVRLLESGSRRELVAAAEKGAEAARGQLAAARSRVGELSITAPIAGVVLLKNFERGEVVAPSAPIVTLGNPDRLWMRVYIATPYMTQVKLGDAAEVRVIGVKRVFTGRVVEIASQAEFTPRAALTEEEQANLVFGVKLALDPSGGALKAGLPADARIRSAP